MKYRWTSRVSDIQYDDKDGYTYTEETIDPVYLAITLSDIVGKIKTYPTPIAACDVHYDWLLSERDRLRNQINNSK